MELELERDNGLSFFAVDRDSDCADMLDLPCMALELEKEVEELECNAGRCVRCAACEVGARAGERGRGLLSYYELRAAGRAPDALLLLLRPPQAARHADQAEPREQQQPGQHLPQPRHQQPRCAAAAAARPRPAAPGTWHACTPPC